MTRRLGADDVQHAGHRKPLSAANVNRFNAFAEEIPEILAQ
jgi:hypothetical protein